MVKKLYSQPDIIEYKAIQFETAQSWNSGKGNKDHNGTGPSGGHTPVGPNPGQGTDGPPGPVLLPPIK